MSFIVEIKTMQNGVRALNTSEKWPKYSPTNKKQSAVDIVINRIVDDVLTGRYKPGDKLPTEMQLAEMMSMSKNTVREAIKILVAYGAVEIRRPEGTFITHSFTPKMLNPVIYSLLFSKSNADDLLGLRRMIDTGVFLLIIDRGLDKEDEAALEAQHIPAMSKSGYEKDTSAALMSTAGAIGIVIPPSITFVVYGSVTGTSVGDLFMAGIIPGILIGVAIYFTMVISSRGCNLVRQPKASGKERWKAFGDAVWGILMPVIILGGIYGGIFTPTEAAAVSAIYGLIVGMFIYKTLRFKEIVVILRQSVSQTAVVMLIIGCAAVFGRFLPLPALQVTQARALSLSLTEISTPSC